MNKFKVMEWIRDVRDKNFEDTKNLSKKELLELYKKKAETIREKSRSYKVAQ
jgi:hypothetical protein